MSYSDGKGSKKSLLNSSIKPDLSHDRSGSFFGLLVSGLVGDGNRLRATIDVSSQPVAAPIGRPFVKKR